VGYLHLNKPAATALPAHGWPPRHWRCENDCCRMHSGGRACDDHQICRSPPRSAVETPSEHRVLG